MESREARHWDKLATWLKANASRTHASLLPPVSSDVLKEQLGANVPPEMIALYGCVGGQSEKAPKNAAGIFRGYWMMPLAGVDGLKTAFADWRTCAENGVRWATANRFPFAKDFGGSYLCFEVQPADGDDPDDIPDAKIVKIEDGESEERYETLWSLLACTLTDLDEGTIVINEQSEERDVRKVLFDATRVRSVGAPAKHSVFEELGIKAVIGDLAEITGHKESQPVHGLLARLTSSARLEIDDVRLVDAQDRLLKANVGCRRVGAKSEWLVWVYDHRPLPAASRFQVRLARIRMVS